MHSGVFLSLQGSQKKEWTDNTEHAQMHAKDPQTQS